MRRNLIYPFCMIVFPVIVVVFFTTLMKEGVPCDMPVGVVDLDNTAMTRSITRQLDASQTSRVVAGYENVDAAREAIQKGEIYAFIYFPKGTESGVMRGDRPTVSYYYSNVTLVAGGMTFRDLKTAATLGAAAVGMTKLAATGMSNEEIKDYLQPISVDLHMIGNPWSNYNIYLSTCMVPGVLMLFFFLITPYSIGTEMKFGTGKLWLRLAHGRIWVALAGKLLPQFLTFLTIFYSFEFYIYNVLGFPHPGGAGVIIIIGLLAVLACEGFGVFAFGLMPSLRMSMSICSLWSVLSFSVCGATFPLFAMDKFIQGVAQLFPLRHYYMIYQMCVFNGYPLSYAWMHVMALCLFVLLPLFTINNVRKAMLKYVYIP